MNHIRLSPDDPELEVWIFFEDNSEGAPVLRSLYADLACQGRRQAKIGPGRLCGKIDEYRALEERGVDKRIRIRMKRDFARTLDGCYIVSARFRRTVEERGLHGIAFTPVAGSEHFVVRPTLIMPIDLATCGVKFGGVACNVCGRYSSTQYSPAISSIEVPDDPLAIFSTTVRHETRKGRWTSLYVSDIGASILQEAGLTGID